MSSLLLDYPGDFASLNRKLAGFYRDTTETFKAGNVPVLALYPFAASGGQDSGLLGLLTDSADEYLSKYS
jgi:hypothetical protein